jgi:uroporphyrin-III C-methyltransferase/precorrin-2 dehydrogenase/sirohydrochlorin ferrochelatase
MGNKKAIKFQYLAAMPENPYFGASFVENWAMSALGTFPVSVKVDNRRIVIVGGGDEAVNKARLAVKTRAEVIVVARQISGNFAELRVILNQRPFKASDLDRAAMVFVADHGRDGEAAKKAARKRGVLLNVVDVPAECDFYTPAIVDRAPISIAISTEGEAPVLARLVRARIEALLTPELGGLARIAGEMRDRVSKLIADGAGRRRYFEALISGPEVAAGLRKGLPEGRRAAMRLLDAYAGNLDRRGAVWLIGAGPGDEDLLTLRAQRRLQEADVIVFDGTVPEALVQMGRRDADRVRLGSGNGERNYRLAADLAKQGKRVAWLVGGDASDVDDILTALRGSDVSLEIVPGVAGETARQAARVA